MTESEKANAYDEALKRAKGIINYYKERNRDEAAIEDLETIFPELKNEDEKIRKALIRFHKSTIDVDGINGDDILTWLEKQKEFGTFDTSQTPIKDAVEVTSRMQFISDDMKPIAEFIMGYANWDLHKDEWNQPTLTVPLFRVLDALIQRGKPYGECNQNIEKQGEQKPILDFKASNFYVSKVDGKIHDMTYNPTDKVEPKFKVKYAGSEYNVLEVKDIAGVTFYGIEDEPNHIDYVKAENCEIISGYAIKENGSPYPTKPAVFLEQKLAWSEEDENIAEDLIKGLLSSGKVYNLAHTSKEIADWLKSLKNRIGG